MEKQLIKVKHTLRLKLMQLHGTTYPTVRKALRYESDSKLSEQIRKSAMEHGGEIFNLKK